MNILKAKNHIKQILKNNHIAVYMHSAPGIGKSSVCKQVAEELDWNFIDLRLSTMMPVDIVGIPFVNKEHTKANWLRPSVFPDQDSKENYLILFDELSNVPMSMQNAAYRIILDRSLGDHYKLPKGARVMAAGNLMTDNSGVQRLSKALANRFVHLNIDADLNSWKYWALKNDIDERIIGFLSFKPDMLFKSPKIEENSFCTPRSWAFVSRLMKFGVIDEEVIAGAIGKGACNEFFSYLEVYEKLPDIDKILDGDKVKVPKDLSVLYALSTSLVTRATNKNVDNIFKYCANMPKEFEIKIAKDIAMLGEESEILFAYSDYKKWLLKHKDFFLE